MSGMMDDASAVSTWMHDYVLSYLIESSKSEAEHACSISRMLEAEVAWRRAGAFFNQTLEMVHHLIPLTSSSAGCIDWGIKSGQHFPPMRRYYDL
jgi:hypothetical protein